MALSNVFLGSKEQSLMPLLISEIVVISPIEIPSFYIYFFQQFTAAPGLLYGAPKLSGQSCCVWWKAHPKFICEIKSWPYTKPPKFLQDCL